MLNRRIRLVTCTVCGSARNHTEPRCLNTSCPEHRPTQTLPELEALRRLLKIAMSDTGQSRRVADFLLAWHNGPENGGWDPTDLWSVDAAIADDIVLLIQSIRIHHGEYPGDLGFQDEIAKVWELWRVSRKPK